MKEIELTVDDIKYIKGEKRIAYVFSSMLFFFLLLFSLAYYLIYGIDCIFLIIDASLLPFCFLLPVLMNKKYNTDVKSGVKTAKIEKVQSKEQTKSYEAGSGNLYIPVLGNLFPKMWGSHPRMSYIYYLIINNIRYRAGKESYEKVESGDYIEVFYTTYSHMQIGFGDKIEK
ncbi:hypothetical protein GGR21_001416 [Dysgonomonas hofstadii]|uniref:Uncharacterized protein n=1 Tax=Dysgonomonas hofstadii TaxID=637886 RepID=A0A840CUT2_9BACT|nr:hypothetical protein [Dysgonomonas hofstadii]MBB4035523.1 hypothetical protein [Dysgonomonas hofstadii]